MSKTNKRAKKVSFTQIPEYDQSLQENITEF